VRYRLVELGQAGLAVIIDDEYSLDHFFYLVAQLIVNKWIGNADDWLMLFFARVRAMQ
jgi:hypothetical protein